MHSQNQLLNCNKVYTNIQLLDIYEVNHIFVNAISSDPEEHILFW